MFMSPETAVWRGIFSVAIDEAHCVFELFVFSEISCSDFIM